MIRLAVRRSASKYTKNLDCPPVQNLAGRPESLRVAVRLRLRSAWLAGSLFLATPALAINVGGTLSTNTVWTLAQSPYVVTSELRVAVGVTLTIEPGVVVQFNQNQRFVVYGTLLAVGNETSRILFTSSQATPTAGYWRSLIFEPGSTASRLSYVTVSYGGQNSSWSGYANVYVNSVSPAFDHLTVTNSATAGIRVLTAGASPTVTSSEVRSSAWAGIRVDSGAAVTVTDTVLANNGGAMEAWAGSRVLGLTGMTVTGNGGGSGNAVAHYGGVLTGDETWLPGIDWRLVNDFQVGSAANSPATWTVGAGTTVRVDASRRIVVYGTMTALGEPTAQITFTSSHATPTPGSWRSLIFEAGSSASRLSYVTVSYGGQNSAWSGYANVYVNGVSPSFDHLTVTNSATAGIRVLTAGASPTITSSQVRSSLWAGIRVDSTAAVTVTDTVLADNGGAMEAWAGSRILGLTGMTVTGNGGGSANAVLHYGGVLTGDETWLPGIDWRLVNDFQVGSAANSPATWTVGAGTTVRVDPSRRFVVYGTMTALGEPAAPITFTSSQATPTAGSWRSLIFDAGSSASRLSYVTVSYGGQNHGWSGYANVYVNGVSPSFDHLTVTNSATAGIRVLTAGASPTISNSEVRSSLWSGIQVDSGAAVTVTDTVLADNSAAMQAWAGSRILGLTGMTVTGNGGGAANGVAHYGGTVTGSETWLSGIEWHLLEDLQIGSPTGPTAELNIEAGSTVRMDQYQRVLVNGTLTAIGSSGEPILFTSRQAVPTPGYWRGLLFGVGSSASRMSHVTVSYGGQESAYSGYGAVYVDGGSPVFDHLRVTDSATYGVRAGNAPGLRVTNSVFARTAWGGIGNFTPLVPFDGRLNYWDSADGPSGEGAGAGESVTAGVHYEPWLVDEPAMPQYVVQAVPRNRVFNPTLGIANLLDFSTSESGAWSVAYRDDTGDVVRTISGVGAAATVSWDGRDGGASLVPNGTYTFELASQSSSGAWATEAQGIVVVDASKQLTLSGVGLSNPFFSPNGDGSQDTTTYYGSFSYDDVQWQVTVRNGASLIVRTAAGQGSNFAFAWDGRDQGGQLLGEGTYSLELSTSTGSASAGASASTTVDLTFPVAVFLTPGPTQVLSNVYQNGITGVPITGTAADLNLLNWNLEYGPGTSPAAWTPLRSNVTTPVVNGELGSWTTLTATNGSYSLRLRVADVAGNQSLATITPTVGNFQVALNVVQIDTASGQAVSYVSTVPFALEETLTIRNEAGETVRTIVSSAPREAGSYTDTWNGRDDAGDLLPDGAYFYVASVSTGEHSMLWDLSNEFWNNYSDWTHPALPAFNPFDNRPMTISYNFTYPGRVTFVVSTQNTSSIPQQCTPPNSCIIYDRYEEGGPHTIRWAGLDPSGKYIPNVARYVVFTTRQTFAKNAVVTFGTKPKVLNFEVLPAIFSPAAGALAVDFDLTTHQSQAVTVKLEFENHESRSVLRSMEVQDVSPGAVSLEWDGRADNGMLVAPGRYTVTATVEDSIGNRVATQGLLTIRY